ncbi:hypothetical protein [Adhaeribacter aquaticus]|uniref:hypothetical protein n=1 Tax=Adhaeribacter aquaticus TaxID=299567 RepID=UPI00040DE6C3|nr:hypothetical protein [Adhaeribacter aquaticus]
MNILKFLFPFTYFFRSRLQAVTDIVFHLYYEWLLAFVLLFYFSGNEFWLSVHNFLLAYLAFISIYEIGYLGNDVYSVRNETDPRLRIKNFNPTNFQLMVWVLFRVAVFFVITDYLKVWGNYEWWIFYAVIVVFFYLHNVIKQKELKTFTFINLAFTRFLAPVFIFLSNEHLLLIVPSVLLCYVFYRTLTYMDSKGLLNLPTRKEASFKVNYYLLLGGVSALLSVLVDSFIPVFINVYYLIFWIAFFIKEKGVERRVS